MGWYLRLVDTVRVSRAADSWESRAVGSRKARTVLAVLGARGGETVTIGEIAGALWAGAPPQDPEANVATLVSRLRGRFGPDVILGGRSGYRLGQVMRVDLHEAAAYVSTAERAQPAHSLLVAEQALKLLDGGVALAEYPAAEWAENARELQDSLLHRAWRAARDSALRTGAPRLAQVLTETLNRGTLNRGLRCPLSSPGDLSAAGSR
nr:transcriptional regulator, SARP family [uncultured bacterium]